MATSSDTVTSRAAIAGAGLRLRVGSALLAERLWPALLSLFLVAAIFLCLAWFGVFAAVGSVARVALLAILAIGVGLIVWRSRHVRLPDRATIEQRIEAASHLSHQPLQTQSDRLAGDNADPFAAVLWREHQARMAEGLRGLKGGRPETRSYRLDPFALRALALLLVAIGFAFSFGPRGGRVADAFAPGEPGTLLAATRVDAWATPPGYTGRPPIFLTGPDGGAAVDGPVEVPQGTIVSIRLSDRSGTRVLFQPDGGGDASEIAPVAPEASGVASARPATAGAYEWPVPGAGRLAIETSLRTLAEFRLTVLPDTPPTIRFDGEPKVARSGTLELGFVVADDYGAASGEGELTLRDETSDEARPLVAPPKIELSLPRRTAGEARGRTLIDVTDSPYAGARVGLTLNVRDDAGQAGQSSPMEVTLPERPFRDPLARAVVEQRRILALDANSAGKVVAMLDAVTLRGDEFIPNPGTYLALRAVRERIAEAHDDATLLSAVDFLWNIALGIEDGDASDAQRRLTEAQKNLSQALENGADEQEIAKLTQELREAMREFMQAMAEAMRNLPPQSLDQMGEMQEIRPQDLDRMLDRIEDLARSGSRDAAQQLLSELQSMMSDLQAMRPGNQQQGNQNGQQNPMRQQMNKLGELLQRQQQLMDQTFELGRQQMQREMNGGETGEGSPDGQPRSPSAQDMQEMMDRLQAEQGKLQKELGELGEAMRGQGLQPGPDLGQAGESMGKAQGQIGEGDSEGAVGNQGEAMEALRRGARDAMQQMQQAMGQGEGQGQQPGQPGGSRMGPGYSPARQRSGLDPLGRERQTQGPDYGQDVGVPDEIDTQRAREILDEIRNRLGRQLSPQEERDYLERLLKTP